MKENIFAVIDTETTMKNEDSHLIVEIGMCIGDPYSDEEPEEVRFLIKDTLIKSKHFHHKTAKITNDGAKVIYNVDNRYDFYLEEWANHQADCVWWNDAHSQLYKKLSSMCVDVVTAYNLPFDLKALSRTHSQFTDKEFKFPPKRKRMCLMDICANLAIDKKFHTWFNSLTDEMKIYYTTDKGNIKYSAECIYRYIYGEPYYTEQHTALRDARMEWKLLKYALRHWGTDVKKYFFDNVRSVNWQMVNTVKSKKGKLDIRNGVKKLKDFKQAKQMELSL